MKNQTTIYLADLAHTATVSDTSISIPLGIGSIAAFLDAYFNDAVKLNLFKHPEHLIAAVLREPPTVYQYGSLWMEQTAKSIYRSPATHSLA